MATCFDDLYLKKYRQVPRKIDMSLKDDVTNDVDSTIAKEWDTRDGQVVPKTEDVKLAGGAVKLNATILYADLADSTKLAMDYDKRVAAKIFKCYLSSCSRIIKNFGGEIRSFDGDRVMGVFVGSTKNTAAAKTALTINWAFMNLIKPKLEAKYATLKNGIYTLAQCVGVDTSEVLVVRGGVREQNDLVWIGRAPNIAAKLSSRRNSPYHSYITREVFIPMLEEAKYASDGRLRWEVLSQ
ncbi:MAG: adenylate/guanylate cyclase domain-containing protein, partial [Pyrinomonadaceae bacterium]